MLHSNVLDFDDEKVVKNDTNLKGPMEKEFEKHFSKKIHRNVVSPLRAEPLIKIINKDERFNNRFGVLNGFDDKFEGLEKVKVVKGSWKLFVLMISKTVEITLKHRNTPKNLKFIERICFFNHYGHDDVNQLLIGQQLNRCFYHQLRVLHNSSFLHLHHKPTNNLRVSWKVTPFPSLCSHCQFIQSLHQLCCEIKKSIFSL